MSAKIITRIAPSPTGHLHIGTVRTALYNYLYAQRYGGSFIVRIEDTDRARSTEEYEKEIRDGLTTLGLIADATYRQSERGALYRRHLEAMIERDTAYISKEESKQNPGSMVEVVRLRNPNKSITFIDEVRGDITFDTTELGDMVIARALDDALYHFAVVVDDFDMGVTHVIRGEDHISNTPRQILIQEAIGAPRPVYAHLPLILAPDRSKMSKRHGATSLSAYLDEGFLIDALLNYLALLGWNPGTNQEIFTLPELRQTFDLGGVQKGGAIFDREKLVWFNREHIKRLSDDVFRATVRARIPAHLEITDERLTRTLPLIRERISVLSDIEREFLDGEFTFTTHTPDVSLEVIKWKKDEHVHDALPRLQKVQELLATLTEGSTADEIKAILMPYAEEVGKGEVLWPLRVALTGRERSPDPFTVISVIGINESIGRIKSVCDKMGG